MKFVNDNSWRTTFYSPANAIIRPDKGGYESVAGKVPFSWTLAGTDLWTETLELGKGKAVWSVVFADFVFQTKHNLQPS